jgi:predicted transposase YbfD/YdcC
LTHCIVKKTLDTIVATGNHYVVAIKRNCKKLYSQFVKATNQLTTCIDYYKTEELNKGRKETRIVHVLEVNKEITDYIPHIQIIVRIKRIRENKKKISEEIIYYACDVRYTAKIIYNGIRNHWFIENKLHWVKDVVMFEDKSQNRNIITSAIMSILKSQVISLAYLNSNSVINFQRTIAHNIEQMLFTLE